jgi:glyoxylase-like metal-dependent hydrolase (beta-lactamase superfamily II)
VIRAAEVAMPSAYAFRRPGPRWRSLLPSGEKPLRAPCLAFALQHPDAGVILVDTGLHPDAHADLRADFGLGMSLLFRGLRPVGPPFHQALSEHGIDPTAVPRVIMTHLHVDHTGGMRLLPHARFTVTRPEWAAAQAPRAALAGYVARHLPPAGRVELVDPAQWEPWGPFTRTCDWLGDGSIRLISTPGHTPGHLSVLVRIDSEREVLLVGDAAYTRRSIGEGLLPLRTADDAASRRSLAELRQFAQTHPQALVVPTHDPEAWRELSPLGDGSGG